MNRTRIGIVIAGIAILVCLIWFWNRASESFYLDSPAPESAKKAALEVGRHHISGELSTDFSSRWDDCAVVRVIGILPENGNSTSIGVILKNEDSHWVVRDVREYVDSDTIFGGCPPEESMPLNK